MATPVRPQPAPSVSAILDQLDELEALMQRMLTVPVDRAESDPGAAGTTPAGPTAVEQVPSRRPELAEQTRPFSYEAPDVPALRQESAPRDEEEEEPAPPTRGRPIRPVVMPPRPVWSSPARRSLWRRPLLWIDAAFEHWLNVPGPAGRWLDGNGGRAALGMTGLLLLAGALAWGVWDWRAARPRPAAPPNDAAHLAPREGGR